MWHARHGAELRNPLFPHKDLPAKQKIARILALAFVGGAAILALLIYGPVLGIAGVRIEGLMTIAAADVESLVTEQRGTRRLLILPQNNVVVFDTAKLASTLHQSYALETVDVARDGRLIVITAKEKVLHVAVRDARRTFFVGRDGNVIREATAEESKAVDVRLGLAQPQDGETLPVFQPGMPVIRVPDVADGQPVIMAAERVETVIHLVERLFAMRIKPLLMTFARNEDPWITVRTEAGYDVLVDITEPLEGQLQSLKAVLDNGEGVSYEYIDVRFGEHIFVKEL